MISRCSWGPEALLGAWLAQCLASSNTSWCMPAARDDSQRTDLLKLSLLRSCLPVPTAYVNGLVQHVAGIPGRVLYMIRHPGRPAQQCHMGLPLVAPEGDQPCTHLHTSIMRLAGSSAQHGLHWHLKAVQDQGARQATVFWTPHHSSTDAAGKHERLLLPAPAAHPHMRLWEKQ